MEKGSFSIEEVGNTTKEMRNSGGLARVLKVLVPSPWCYWKIAKPVGAYWKWKGVRILRASP